MKRTSVLIAAAVLATAAAGADDPEKRETGGRAGETAAHGAAISDGDLSLYPGSVFQVPEPRGFRWNDSDPGDNERLPRAYPGAPPRIPHGIGDFLPLTRSSHACLDCHAAEGDEGDEGDAPPLPASHRTDLRNAPERVGAELAGARRDCLACHVPVSDAKPLRANAAAPAR
ncbi:MAG: Nitrate reductase cytochrome c550-type subunit [Acidobacteria bacterium]|jgi:cytochrome c-type protein NapB|nr:Nitrate reductase cytochrome c550-type subunit [Acidobacteriota bacterium]